MGSFDRRLYAVNAADGSVAWTFETGGEIWSSPVLDPAGDRYEAPLATCCPTSRQVGRESTSLCLSRDANRWLR